MQPLTETEIRESMVNAPAGEADRMPLPGLHEVIWDEREYLGWRDPQAPQRGYVVFWRDGAPVGLTLRASESQLAHGSAMCSLCQTLQPAGQVRMFSARRAGDAGDRGNSVGTYICSDLACSTLIRLRAPGTELDHSPAEIIQHRADGLTQRLARFTEKVVAP
jgi:hypothetical protein